MPEVLVFDWTTFGVLSALVLWDGVQRVPPGAWQLRRVPGYAWAVTRSNCSDGAKRLASWLSPLVLHATLVSEGRAGLPLPRHLGLWIMTLRLPAAAALMWLVVGVPLLTPSLGFAGFVRAVAASLLFSATTALVAVAALRRFGVPRHETIHLALPLVSPFTAPRAPEIVLARALRDVSVVVAMKALLPPEGFAAWARPLAYDALKRPNSSDPLQAEILAARELLETLAAPPAGAAADERYCPRCGRLYVATIATCDACEDLALETVSVPNLRTTGLRPPAQAHGSLFPPPPPRSS